MSSGFDDAHARVADAGEAAEKLSSLLAATLRAREDPVVTGGTLFVAAAFANEEAYWLALCLQVGWRLLDDYCVSEALLVHARCASELASARCLRFNGAQAWNALIKKRRKGKKAAAAAHESAAVGLDGLRLQLVSTGRALERGLQVGVFKLSAWCVRALLMLLAYAAESWAYRPQPMLTHGCSTAGTVHRSE